MRTEPGQTFTSNQVIINSLVPFPIVPPIVQDKAKQFLPPPLGSPAPIPAIPANVPVVNSR
jgi:hypothetical protein